MSWRMATSLVGLAALLASSCTGSDDDSVGSSGGTTAVGGNASGGTNAGTGGTSATGGAGGTGAGGNPGSDAGTGGTSTGPGRAFTCPAGSESLVVDLEGVTVEGPLGTLPTDAVNRENLEGPVWIDGALYASHFALFGAFQSQILRYTPGGSFQVVVPDSGTNGLAVDGAGMLFAGRHANGSISTFDLGTPSMAAVVVADTYDGMFFKSPNDLVIRSDGTIYFTDPNWQEGGNTQSPRQTVERAYRITPAPQRTVHPIDTTPGKPNGIALSPDENVLYIGGSSMMKYVVAEDGSVTANGAFGSGGSDGLTVDCAGNVYAASGSTVAVFSAAGMPLGQISVPASATNVAFGGPNRTTLYITKMQPPALYRVELNVPGFPY